MTRLSGILQTGHGFDSKLCVRDLLISGVTSSGCSRVDAPAFLLVDSCLLPLWLNDALAVIDEGIRTVQSILISAGHVQGGKSSGRSHIGRECHHASECEPGRLSQDIA